MACISNHHKLANHKPNSHQTFMEPLISQTIRICLSTARLYRTWKKIPSPEMSAALKNESRSYKKFISAKRRQHFCELHRRDIDNIPNELINSTCQTRSVYTFIDYQKAFDPVDRCTLWLKLIDCGIGGRILRIIQDFFSDFSVSFRVRMESNNAKTFLRSSFLFSLTTSRIFSVHTMQALAWFLIF